MGYQQVIAKKVKLNGLVGMQHHRECARIPLALAMGRNRALLFRVFLVNILNINKIFSKIKSDWR